MQFLCQTPPYPLKRFVKLCVVLSLANGGQNLEGDFKFSGEVKFWNL